MYKSLPSTDTVRRGVDLHDRRIRERAAVDVWVDELHEGALYYQRATNLSLGGVYLERTLPHAPGTEVALTLRIPDGQPPLSAAGEVIDHEGERGMGVRFTALSPHDRARLANFLLRCVC